MSEEPLEQDELEDELDEEGPPTTPFDHPFFLPILLVGFGGWFGYDGWFNADMEWIKFNRYGFGFLLGPAILSTISVTRVLPFGVPVVYLANAIWLAYMGWLGSDGNWYNDGEMSLMFNRYASGLALLLAVYTGWRSRRRLEAGLSASAPE